MWRLIRADRDRGALAILMAIFLPAVILGLGALVIDVGSWYSSRAQDQNGADAAVVAVARSCAPGPACTAATANVYANSASNGGLAGQVKVCGSTASSITSGSTGLVSCSSLGIPEDGTACPKDPGTQYVDAFVQPKNTDNSGTVTSFLGYGKQNIAACAQAIIGQAGGGTGLALTMSFCAWERATKVTPTSPPKYATPAPPYRANPWPPGYSGTVSSGSTATPNVGGENVIQLQGSENPCSDGPSGQNQPGGFGWLSDQPNGAMPANCSVATTAGGYVYSGTGGIGGGSSDCATRLQAMYDASTGTQTIPNSMNPAFIPVFDLSCNSTGKLEPAGTTNCPAGMPNGSYHIAGYAEFILTGIHYNPVTDPSLITNTQPCTGSAKCLYGLFTQGLVSGPAVCSSNCQPYGPVAVKLNG